MAVLKIFKGNILEENLARTTGAVGEALAAGAIFTIPAFLMTGVWDKFDLVKSTLLMLIGGLLGVFFIILVRRTLVEDAELPFPESVACAEMVKTGGLGDSMADLPVAGCAPEYMSEKAITIGQYFVASGVFTVFGVTFPIVEGTKFHKHLFEELEELGMGKWGFATDPYEMARMMIEHIDKKRRALGIDKARERVLMDMADRQKLEAA